MDPDKIKKIHSSRVYDFEELIETDTNCIGIDRETGGLLIAGGLAPFHLTSVLLPRTDIDVHYTADGLILHWAGEGTSGGGDELRGDRGGDGGGG